MGRAFSQKRTRQAARAGTDLDDCRAFQRPPCTGDLCSEIEIEKEVLPQRFSGIKAVSANDLAQRRQVAERGHGVGAAASLPASAMAAIRLSGRATPLPAMSNAVP